MRTPKLALLALAAAVLAGCGDTLVDHTNTSIQEEPGGSVCGTSQITCDVNGTATCFAESVTHCGSANGLCSDCTAGFAPPHVSAVPACIITGAAGSGRCGFACTGGFLKCGSTCCSAVALAAGPAHSCAVTADGRLQCWGRNAEGQVTGTPTAAPVLTPHEVFDGGVVAVAAGTAHTCAAVSGQVRCIGDNSSGAAPATLAVNAVELAAGDRHTCAREATTGRVTCWGASNVGQTGGGVPVSTGASAIAAGADHACAIVSGAVRCWGSRASGQLGDGSTTGSSSTPVTVPGLSGMELVTAGGNHTCASRQSPVDVSGGVSNALVCWGDAPGTPFVANDVQASPDIPKRGDGSQSLARGRLARLAAGRTHTCFQPAGAQQMVQCVGQENGAGQLGGVPEPGREVEIQITIGATALGAGGDHGCAVFQDGGLRCWGLNSSGQLGNGSTTNPGLGILVPVSGR